MSIRQTGVGVDNGRCLSGPRSCPSGRADKSSRRIRAAIAIAGPSDRFLRLTRNPDLEPPERFIASVKQPGDVVL